MVLVIATVALLASWSAVGYIRSELADGHTTPAAARLFGLLVPAFIASMVLAVLAANLGIMWVAIEATTIATTFLVGHHRNRASLEASWKYVIIGSVGIVLAFLGTVLLSYATQHAGPGAHSTLDWDAMRGVARHLDPAVIRVAAVLLLLGYGTKIGLAPMHTWLPDAHSQAPAPVSALMSGVLLSVAFYAMLRVKVIVDLALGPTFLRNLLVVAALLSLVVAASLLIAQRDYKRLLAYSSIEHMGLIALAAAIGTPLAIAALLLHILAHGLGKTVAFLCSGEILLVEGTTRIAGVRGLLARRPLVGGSFGLALLALLGFPPFGLFASELAIARAGFSARHGLGHRRRVLTPARGRRRRADARPQHAAWPRTPRRSARRALGEPACLSLRAWSPSPRSASPSGRSSASSAPPPTSWPNDRSPDARLAGSPPTSDDDRAPARGTRTGMRTAARQRVPARHDRRPRRRTRAACRVPVHVARRRPAGRADRAHRLRAPRASESGELSFPAGRFEREIADLFGVEPVDHPLPRRLVLHQHWPDGWHPMRQDAGPTPTRDDAANRSRSSPSKAPASTRSRSDPSTRASSNPVTSASRSSARPSST